MATLEQALTEALEPPDSYWGPITDLVQQGWAQVYGRHRDSDLLNISNFESMLEHYNENYEVNDDFRVEGSSHWLVGWSDCLLVRALQCDCEDWEDADFYAESGVQADTRWRCRTCATLATVRQIFIDALDFQKRMDDYPVLDEEDWCRREHEEFMEYIEQEVGTEYAEACARYLFDIHSYSCVEDIDWKVLEAWKEENVSSE
jgi:hypothetical protein